MIAGVLLAAGVLFLVYRYQQYAGNAPPVVSSQSLNLLQNRNLTGASVMLNQSSGVTTIPVGGLTVWHTNQAGGSNVVQPGIVPGNKATPASWAFGVYAPPYGPNENQNGPCAPPVLMMY